MRVPAFAGMRASDELADLGQLSADGSKMLAACRRTHDFPSGG
jgi:hypothetical protein